MRHWPAIITAVAAIAAAIPVVRHFASADDARNGGQEQTDAPTDPKAVDPPALAGLQMNRMLIGRQEVTAPGADGRLAHLTLDPDLQRTAVQQFRKLGIPSGALVMMDLESGRLVVYASKTSGGPPKDLCAAADQPAASVFKIITGTALVDWARLGPDTRQCYRGGLHEVTRTDLEDNPKRDKWCATISEAMGRSLNTVFARLASRNLDGDKLKRTALSYGFLSDLPFDLPVEQSKIEIPDDDLEFARTAAGFWHTTLSPLHATMIAQTIANQGQMIRPVLVSYVTDRDGKKIYRAPMKPSVIRRAIRPETAAALQTMLTTAVSTGTAYEAFHDASGRAYLPGVTVWGKTGTLTRTSTQEFITWFVGYAGTEKPEVAFAALVVNKPTWQTKANVFAREMLRAYYAARGAPGVTAP
jgi:peptidoglycan glycosyltransferase